MCWFIAYRENKIAVSESFDYSLYKKVNVLGENNYNFSTHEVDIEGKKYFSITHNLCACDFFTANSSKPSCLRLAPLREEFQQFILDRMEYPCIEPTIITKWDCGHEEFTTESIKKVKLNISEINKILENEEECIYRVVRA